MLIKYERKTIKKMKTDGIDDTNIINKFTGNIGTVVLVFEKEWSGACQLLEPILTKLSFAFENSLRIIRINIEQNSKLADHYNINQVPTIFVLKEGNIMDTIVGLVPYEIIKTKISQLIKK